jgi:hypothetical protein
MAWMMALWILGMIFTQVVVSTLEVHGGKFSCVMSESGPKQNPRSKLANCCS